MCLVALVRAFARRRARKVAQAMLPYNEAEWRAMSLLSLHVFINHLGNLEEVAGRRFASLLIAPDPEAAVEEQAMTLLVFTRHVRAVAKKVREIAHDHSGTPFEAHDNPDAGVQLLEIQPRSQSAHDLVAHILFQTPASQPSRDAVDGDDGFSLNSDMSSSDEAPV